MLNSSRKKKGKKLEKFVAERLQSIFPFAYSRADSGSGKNHKEDVTVPFNVPLFIECKNQASLALSSWWEQTLRGCPKSKMPILVYRLDYQPLPTVYLKLPDLISLISGIPDLEMTGKVWLSWEDFEQILKQRYQISKPVEAVVT